MILIHFKNNQPGHPLRRLGEARRALEPNGQREEEEEAVISLGLSLCRPQHTAHMTTSPHAAAFQRPPIGGRLPKRDVTERSSGTPDQRTPLDSLRRRPARENRE